MLFRRYSEWLFWMSQRAVQLIAVIIWCTPDEVPQNHILESHRFNPLLGVLALIAVAIT